jgi:hypothetical protein
MRIPTSDPVPTSSPAPPVPASLADPGARAAAVRQLSHLPWGHPHAVELRRLFRGEGA